MSLTYPGGYITKSPPTPTSTSAPGIWTMDQALQYIKAGTWPTPPIGDPYWQYTALLSGTGSTNGAQNNTFIDSSSNNFTVTRNGNTTQGTFTPFSVPNGYWGNYFDGSGDYLTISHDSNLDIGNGDFTIEAWLYLTSLAADQDPFGKHADIPSSASDIQWYIYIGANNSGNEAGICVGSSYLTITGWSVVANTWNHFVLVRSGNSMKVYINGTNVGNTRDVTGATPNTNAAWKTWIGTYRAAARNFNGYISNFRIVKGTAVYTSNFTPSTSPLTAISNTQLLTCQSNRFVDNSANAFAITANGNSAVVPFAPFGNPSMYSTTNVGGSGYFDGTGDYLSLTTNSSFVISGDFTVEFWAYFLSTGTYQPLLDQYNDAGFLFRVSPGATINGDWYINSTSGSDGIGSFSGTACPINAWNFFRLVRSGSTVTVYCNGVSVGTRTRTGNIFANSSAFSIANYSSGYFTGYLSGLRIVPTALTGTEIPTAPPTVLSNTRLLLNYTNAGITDATAKNVLETVGNAQIDTGTKKFGTGSLEFDGTGDYLVLPASPSWALGGDFTVEFWINTSGANSQLLSLVDGTSAGYWQISLFNNEIYFQSARNTTDAIVRSSTAIADSNWHHVAFTKSGTTLRCFFDGTKQGADATDSTSYNITTSKLNVGYSSSAFTGFLDDIRITKGVARYTANFTAPTKAFPDQ